MVKAEVYLQGFKRMMGREEMNSMNINYSFEKVGNERKRTEGEAGLRNYPFSKEATTVLVI